MLPLPCRTRKKKLKLKHRLISCDCLLLLNTCLTLRCNRNISFLFLVPHNVFVSDVFFFWMNEFSCYTILNFPESFMLLRNNVWMWIKTGYVCVCMHSSLAHRANRYHFQKSFHIALFGHNFPSQSFFMVTLIVWSSFAS